MSANIVLKIFDNNKFAAIISDMGRKGGTQERYVLLEKIRKSGDKTPFIIYAGSNLPEHKKLAREKGAQGSTNQAQDLHSMVMNIINKFKKNHGSYRKSVPDSCFFDNLNEVRELTEQWMIDYNEHKPHESLGDISPKAYLEKMKLNETIKEAI